MQLIDIPTSIFRPQPPPLWLVTNGDITVGPVVTDLLTRGVQHGRVPDYCHVRPFRGEWRPLAAVREISALYRTTSEPTANPEQTEIWARRLDHVKDEMELYHTVTWLSLLATGAESAMFHCRPRAERSLVTRSVLGPMSNERLGYVLPEHDLVLKSARAGRPVTGPPYGPTEDALAMRFASSMGGAGAVAMIPIFVTGKLTAMLELSRPGHAFRRSDLKRAEHIAQRALRKRTT